MSWYRSHLKEQAVTRIALTSAAAFRRPTPARPSMRVPSPPEGVDVVFNAPRAGIFSILNEEIFRIFPQAPSW